MESFSSYSPKIFELNNEGKNFICKIELIKEQILANLYLDRKLIYQGKIYLEQIQLQIKAFLDFNINQIFNEINQLNPKSFSISKEKNKYKLKIEFLILSLKKNIIIDLNENNLDDDIINNYEDIIKGKDSTITKLEKNITELNKKIEELENKLRDKNDNKIDKRYNLNKDFNIEFKNPIYISNHHVLSVVCLILLKDGRIASCSNDCKIIIYNKENYEPDLIIEEHKNFVVCIIQLCSGILASCSYDKTIKLFNINEKEYKVMQTLKHNDAVFKIIELKNEYLVSSSDDKLINFYKKYNNEYKLDFKIKTYGPSYSIIQTKESEICYSEKNDKNNYNICFYDLNNRKIIEKIKNISSNRSIGSFNMITKDLLFIGGKYEINLINVDKHELIRKKKFSKYIFYGFCMLNENMFITGDSKGAILQWKIEGDDIILISQKDKAHNETICSLILLDNGQIASGSKDAVIKIW